MGLRTRKVEDFTTITKDTTVYGENIVFIRGGSVVINKTWVHFNDITLDLKKTIEDYTKGNPRLFNSRNGIIYILVCLLENGSITLVPSISYLQTTTGDIKSFPDLSGKLPLLLVKLVQDGSYGLTGFNPITKNDIQLYDGYGNFTLNGDLGDTGAKGATGLLGITGQIGVTGHVGVTGQPGVTGTAGVSVKGLTGAQGTAGERVFWVSPVRVPPPIADFYGVSLTLNTVQFTDQSLGNPTIWYWDFGDGNTSTSQNPINTYADVGTYDVFLRAENEAGFDTTIKFAYVVVSAEFITIQDVADDTVETWQDEADDTIIIINDTPEEPS